MARGGGGSGDGASTCFLSAYYLLGVAVLAGRAITCYYSASYLLGVPMS